MTAMRAARTGLIIGAVGLLLPAIGCQPSERRSGTTPTTMSATTQPAEAMVQSDAQRAQDAIERNQREMSGERQPYERPAERPVDQPPVGGRR